jgi:uncharacterized protein YutE (UPF0331/DUF86 family)
MRASSPPTLPGHSCRWRVFRNILVHVYAQVNIERVYECLQSGLDDFARFTRYVIGFLAREVP